MKKSHCYKVLANFIKCAFVGSWKIGAQQSTQISRTPTIFNGVIGRGYRKSDHNSPSDMENQVDWTRNAKWAVSYSRMYLVIGILKSQMKWGPSSMHFWIDVYLGDTPVDASHWPSLKDHHPPLQLTTQNLALNPFGFDKTPDTSGEIPYINFVPDFKQQ